MSGGDDGEVASVDGFVEAIDNAKRAAAALHRVLDLVVGLLDAARRQRLEGTATVEIVRSLLEDGGTRKRRSVDEAFAEYARAVTVYRAVAIRALVDEGEMTLSDVAGLIGISRQMVGRLYRLAPENGILSKSATDGN